MTLYERTERRVGNTVQIEYVPVDGPVYRAAKVDLRTITGYELGSERLQVVEVGEDSTP